VGGEYAIERLNERLQGILQPRPNPSDPHAVVHSLMVRESIDLTARECSGFTTLFSRAADAIAAKARTENQRRKQIVPATPVCLRLKETVLRAVTALDGCVAEGWIRDDASSEELRPVLERIFLPGHAEAYLDGRSSLLGADSAQVQLTQLLSAMQRLESHWGSFEIWVRRPRLSTCRSLIRAWQNCEIDAEQFLTWLRQDELEILDNGLDPYIAQALLGMRLSNSELIIPGDMTVKSRRGEEMSLTDVPESELYDRLMEAAQLAKRRYEHDGRVDSRGHFVCEVANLDPLFSESGETKASGAIDKASWHASASPEIRTEYEDWDGILQSAGVNPRQRRALLLRKNGEITSRNRLDEWKRGERVINRKRSALVRAIEAATRKRIIMAPQISAANYSGVIREGGGFVRPLPEDDKPAANLPPDEEGSKWFGLNPPPITPSIRKIKHLFKKVST
jgi:hypothetical protein